MEELEKNEKKTEKKGRFKKEKVTLNDLLKEMDENIRSHFNSMIKLMEKWSEEGLRYRDFMKMPLKEFNEYAKEFADINEIEYKKSFLGI